MDNMKSSKITAALDPTDQTLYTVSATWGQWTNTTGFVRTDTNNDLLVQKRTPGDFNTDDIVDFADVQLAGTATKPCTWRIARNA